MNSGDFLIRAERLVTASDSYGTISNGAFVVHKGKIKDLGEYSYIAEKYGNMDVVDYSNYTVTPSLVDCHTHLLEYAPSAVYNTKNSAGLMGGISLLLEALSSGVTCLGEQICGSPDSRLLKKDYYDATRDFPIDIVFSVSEISIGLRQIIHFTGITGAVLMDKDTILSYDILSEMIRQSDYPGENIFINATPANLTEKLVPRAGEIIFTQEELNRLVKMFHDRGKRIGCHVAGEEAIDMAIEAGFDVLHHGHGITEEQIRKVFENNILIVATPLGGTHLKPNSPDNIATMVEKGITVAVSSDGYLPPHSQAEWLSFDMDSLRGPESLMALAAPSMKKLKESGWNENDILKLITLYPAAVLGKDKCFGSLDVGKDASFLAAKGIPGIEITDPGDILSVYYKGENVINKIR